MNGHATLEYTTWNGGGASNGAEAGTLGHQVQEAMDFSNALTALTVEPAAAIQGRPIKKLSYEWTWKNGETDETSQTVFHVDEERGYIPVREEHRFGQELSLMSESHVTEIRRCSRDRWFPARCVVVYPPGKWSGADSIVREIVVEQLDVDRRPSKDRFRLAIPAGTQVNDGSGNVLAHFTPEAPEVVTLNSLEELYNRTQAAMTQRQGRAVPERPATWQWWAAAGTVLLAVLAAVGMYLRRRQSSSAFGR
jgi:hypothetical protein